MSTRNELEELEGVLLRLAYADSDEQLQGVVSRFLPAVLLTLCSPQDGVRDKAMEVLGHLNKRVRSRPKIQLPVEELLRQYRDPAFPQALTHFTIIYVRMGYPRLEVGRRCELAPVLLAALEGKPQPQQDALMHLLIPVLYHIQYSTTDSSGNAAFALSLTERPATAKLLLEFMLDVLLMPYGYKPPSSSSTCPREGGSMVVAAAGDGLQPQPPPGMSVYAASRVAGEFQWGDQQLEQCKLGIVRFLEAGQVPEVDTVVHLVVASADSRHSVASAADLSLRSRQSAVDWNDPSVVGGMYKLYLGDVPLKTKGASAVKPEVKRRPVSTRVKIKVLTHLLRSRLAAESFPANIQVVYGGLFGADTNNRLLALSLQFVHHVCIFCPATNQPLGLMLLNGLTKLINEYKEDPKSLGVAYSAIGKLSSHMPQLFSKNIALVQQLFESMCRTGEPDVRLAIQEALSMMAGAYANLKGSELTLMLALVAAYVGRPEVQVRQVAIKFASTVFEPDHVESRYLLLLAAGDPREEVCGEARRVLRSFDSKSTKEGSKPLPSFTEMVAYVQEKAVQNMKMPAKYVVGTSTVPFEPAAFGEIMLYLRTCLTYSSGAKATSLSKSQLVAEMQDDTPVIGRYVRTLLTSDPQTSPSNLVCVYTDLLQQLLSATRVVPIMYCLLEVVSVCPEKLAPRFFGNFDWIKSLMKTNKEDMRELAAQLYAVVVSTMSGNELKTAVYNLVMITKDSHSPETQHGAIMALGHMVGRYMRKKHAADQPLNTNSQGDEEEAVITATRTIGSFLDSSSALLAVAACTALGEIGRNGPLLVPSEGRGFTKLSVVENLLARIPSGKESNKMKERSIHTLGYLPVGDVDFPHQKKILKGLMDSVEAKQVELQFTVGEAITNAALGSSSGASRDPWTCTEDDYTPPLMSHVKNNDVVPWVLASVLTKYIPSQNPHVRQAACIWLLSLVKKLSHHKEIRSNLKQIQAAFISALSDPDELSQDVASKGLGLVYEMGGEGDQQELVSTLVETLMTGRRVKHVVSDDTEVFQGEALGKAPDGHGLSTYKELCSLASDLNQPDLIYKFMNLANHHAMWNSRKGAAFGFHIIAAKAGEQLTPYLPQLVPRLYCYQFDPNLGIRQAMSSIWDALVKDKTLVDKYLKDILQHVISNLTNNTWRIRESSCLALNDLIRGRQADDITEHLAEMWETLFRVLDDIKESVRKAADVALKTLSKVCTRMCESTSAAAQRTVAIILPPLLDKGIVSNVSEVRSLSLQTLVKISKTAGAMLKPHTPQLIPALLEALSTLEPQVLNYLSVRATEQERSAMDTARLTAAKSSPMMETINVCLWHLDVSVLGELVPRLCELLKSGVGPATKGGCASVIVSLALQCPRDLTTYSGKLINALLNGVHDRSAAVQKAYASALGHVVRAAKDSSVEKLLLKLNAWYLEKEDPAYRSFCVQTVHAINRHSPEVLKSHAAVALPLTFLGMHQEAPGPEEKKGEGCHDATLWAEVWQENIPGSSGGVRLYMTELIAITQKALQSQSWKTKAQGAAAMATIAKAQSGSLVAPHLGTVLTALMQGLSGRTWAGKEELLKAIGSVARECHSELRTPQPGQPAVSEVLVAVMKECRRTKESLAYKMAALRCAGDVLHSSQEDGFSDMAQILIPLIRKRLEGGGGGGRSLEEEEEEEEDVKDGELRTEALLCAWDTLAKSWPKTPHTQTAFQAEVCALMCDVLRQSSWRVQLGVLRCMKAYFQGLLLLQKDQPLDSKTPLSQILSETCAALACPLENKSYASVRSEALSVVELLLRRTRESGRWDCLTPESRRLLQSSLSGLLEDIRPDLKDQALELHGVLQSLQPTSPESLSNVEAVGPSG